jgi:hypothetical protein
MEKKLSRNNIDVVSIVLCVDRAMLARRRFRLASVASFGAGFTRLLKDRRLSSESDKGSTDGTTHEPASGTMSLLPDEPEYRQRGSHAGRRAGSSSNADSSIAYNMDAEDPSWLQPREARLNLVAAKGAQSKLGKKEPGAGTPGANNKQQKYGGSAVSRRRAAVAGMAHTELATEMMRFGRHAAKAEHLTPVLEEVLRRSALVTQPVIRDAIYLANACGLHQLAVSIYIARGRTHDRDANYTLYEVVVDSAFALGSADTIAQVCRAIQTKMSIVAAREVPSELALYRALWRLRLLFQDAPPAGSTSAETPLTLSRAHPRPTMQQIRSGGNATQAGRTRSSSRAQCMDAARTVFNIILSYDKENLLDNCTRLRHVTLPLGERYQPPAAATTAASTMTPAMASPSKMLALRHEEETSGLRPGKETTTEAFATSVIMTPDEALSHFMSRIGRVSRYGGDRGELAFTLMVHDEYCSRSKRRISPATRYTALFRACRATARGDAVHAYFLQYLQLLWSTRTEAEQLRGRSSGAGGGNATDSSEEEAVLPADLEALLASVIDLVDELVIHAYFGAMNHCRQFARVVEVTKLLLSGNGIRDRYTPSASVLALSMRAVGETQAANVAEMALTLLLSSASGAAPTPHEVFLSLLGLAKCGLPTFHLVLTACIDNELIEGGAEERGYLMLQHALNTQDVVASMKAVETMMADARVELSERMMVLFLQCLLRSESDELYVYFKRFCAKKGGVQHALPAWVELLVRWAERRRYSLSDEQLAFIVDEVLASHGLDDVERGHGAIARLEMSYRKSLLLVVHDRRFRTASRKTDAATRAFTEPAPDTHDPRLFFLTHAYHPVVSAVGTSSAEATTIRRELLTSRFVRHGACDLTAFALPCEAREGDLGSAASLCDDILPIALDEVFATSLPSKAGERLGPLADRVLDVDRRMGLQHAADSVFGLRVTPAGDGASDSAVLRAVAVSSELRSVSEQQWSADRSYGAMVGEYSASGTVPRRMPRPDYTTWGDVLRMPKSEFDELVASTFRAEHDASNTTPARLVPMEM